MTPNPWKSMLGGFVGTGFMTLLMYFVAPLMLSEPMDVAAMLSGMLGISWTMGMALHFINGTIIFPLIYAYLLYRVLPGQPWLKGAWWGVILWFLAQVVVMPMAGAGLFSANAGGLMAVMASLVGHLMYGLFLGGVAGSGHAQADRMSEAKRMAA